MELSRRKLLTPPLQVSEQVKLSPLRFISLSVHSDTCRLPAPSDQGPILHTAAPLKYAIPHAVVSFGPAGQLIRVTPGLSTQENVSQLEVHSLEVSPTAACVQNINRYQSISYN